MDPFANPWTRHSSREIYANPWMRVREDAVTRPDGKPGVYGVVEFRSRAIGVVPLTADGQTLLVGQWRYTLGRYSWEIPEGGGAMDEAPQAAAARELREETGYTARTWTYLGELTTSNSVTDEIGCVFLAEDLEAGEAEPEGTEKLMVRKVPLEEAVRMAVTGEIDDGLAVIGLLRAWHHLQGGRALKPIQRSFPGLGEPPT